MKPTILLMTALAFYSTVYSQQLQPHAGGEYNLKAINEPCLSEQQREEIIQQNKAAINELRTLGKIPGKTLTNTLIFPLKLKNGLTDPGFYGISGFVDHNPNYPNQLLDYNNGTRTYDLSSGYNHQGTDFFLWPFSWFKMDNDEVEVIAAADGIIIGKEDGYFDRNCGFNSDNWNAVYVRNTDGSVMWYGHFKKNTTTNKSVGQNVSAGEYLGIVGSSGSSTAPHLHLEVYDANFNLIDPWAGPANTTITSSWWVNQKPYYDSKVNKVASHSKWPVFPDCPQQEVLYYKNEFAPGDTIYLVTYYQDQLQGQVSSYQILMPDNIVWHQWTHSMNVSHYAASWWGWWWRLPSNAALGDWTFSVVFNGNLYSHKFKVTNNPTSVDEESRGLNFYLSQNYPNPFNPGTIINYQIPSVETRSERSFGHASFQQHVTLKVYDILGREVETLVDEVKEPGSYKVEWKPGSLSSGIYFYQLRAGEFIQTKKMQLIK